MAGKLYAYRHVNDVMYSIGYDIDNDTNPISPKMADTNKNTGIGASHLTYLTWLVILQACTQN